jgi:hypothetical protein
MVHSFRVSVEGSEVERLLGELLVARASLEAALLEAYILDCNSDGGASFQLVGGEAPWSLAGGPAGSAGPFSAVLQGPLGEARARLTAVIDYLRVEPS